MDAQPQAGLWQSLQATISMVLRSVMMLGCLVSVPMLAVLGGSLPDRIQAFLLSEKLPTTHADPLTAQDQTLAAANSTAPAFPVAAPSAFGSSILEPKTAPTFSEPLSPNHPPWNQPGTAAPEVTAAPYRSAAPYGLPSDASLQDAPTEVAEVPRAIYPNVDSPYSPSERTAFDDRSPYALPETASPAPPAAQPAYDPAVRPAAAELMPPPASSGVPSQGWDFARVQQRLQDLDAVYYRLETWGGREVYRFHCRVQVSESSPTTRHFEAQDADALQAMLQVLQQVEAWRSQTQTQP